LERLSEIATPIAPLGEDDLGSVAYERFLNDQDVLALPVLDSNQQPVGLLERNAFSLRMASAYGRALYAGRPVRLLMDADPLIVDGQTPIMAFTGERLPTHGAAILKGFIVVEGGRYLGVANSIALLAAASEANRRQAEALLAARDAAEASSRAKSEFVANMSHEIRTPLNGVVGVADALAKTDLSFAQREMVLIIQSSAKALNGLLSDVLDLARVESGRLNINPETFDLHDLVREAAALFEPSARAKGLRFVLDLSAASSKTVYGDPVRLRQILFNLLSNAVKFTAQGEVRLTVIQDGAAADPIPFIFEVSDTGVGFDPVKIEAVFDRFQQADGSITRQFGGSGLGLAISRDLASLMGGRLSASSTLGQGAVFRLHLPLAAGALSAADFSDPETAFSSLIQRVDARAGSMPILDHGGATEDGLRVLLADDHPVNRKVVSLILGEGVDLVSVENGLEAVEAFQASEFDLVLMDLQMPVMDGLSAIRAIRAFEQRRGRKAKPILALSANAFPDHVAASGAAGADGHLAKPITAAALIEGMNRVTRPLDHDAYSKRKAQSL
jgi:signal transduction histidine kinase/ActR/RegA family two-component response regulator